MKRKVLVLWTALCLMVSISLFAQGIQEVRRGANVIADEESPSGYTVHFVYDAKNCQDDKIIENVSVWGHFLYVDAFQDIQNENNVYTPHEYRNGMFPVMYAPVGLEYPNGVNGYIEEMKLNPKTGCYETSFPITSGSFVYQYIIQYVGEENVVTIDDPANPSRETDNPTLSPGGASVKSVVYGRYDEEKQSDSPNYDYVLPSKGATGDLEYTSYQGKNGIEYLGIYLPPGYNPSRVEPYKVIFVSHGGGGNELEWFCYGHANNIMDNLIASGETEKAVVVSMDNQYFNWDYSAIEDNLFNYIIPYLENNFNISKETKDRAFCGLSMGGKTTTHLYFDAPDKFGYFGIFSGTDPEAIKEKNGLKDPKVLLIAGNCDFASETIAINPTFNNEILVRWGEEHNMGNFINKGLVPGAHDWFTWPQCFKIFVSEVCWK